MSHTITRDQDLVTLGQFLAMREPVDHRLEVSRGRLVRVPAQWALDSRVAGRLALALMDYDKATRRGFGLLYPRHVLSESPATVRIPDVSFAPTRRIPRVPYHRALWRLAPVLAVKVLSDLDTIGELQERIVDYLEAGVRLVWIIGPDARSATVYRHRQDPFILREGESLDGGDVLPGLSIPLEGIFRQHPPV